VLILRGPVIVVEDHKCDVIGIFFGSHKAQWTASFVVWWLVGSVMHRPCHCVARVGPRKPNMASHW
jgi:hypothetical protein